MTAFSQIILILLALFIGWSLYKYIRVNPQIFSRENLGKSFYSMGILALILIGFIVLLVVLLKCS
jgi:hypothetical protein